MGLRKPPRRTWIVFGAVERSLLQRIVRSRIALFLPGKTSARSFDNSTVSIELIEIWIDADNYIFYREMLAVAKYTILNKQIYLLVGLLCSTHLEMV